MSGFQVPESVKAGLPEHVRKAAREVGLQAWRKRLKEIEMSEYDGEMYERYLAKVQRQVTALRLMLDSLQAKGKERQWMRHQTEGDLDESKLIEGLIGEKSVYKVSATRRSSIRSRKFPFIITCYEATACFD